MPHLLLQFHLCLHVRQVGEVVVVETLLSGKPQSISSSSPAAVSLSSSRRSQACQVRKGGSSILSKASSLALERRIQKQWSSVVDKEQPLLSPPPSIVLDLPSPLSFLEEPLDDDDRGVVVARAAASKTLEAHVAERDRTFAAARVLLSHPLTQQPSWHTSADETNGTGGRGDCENAEKQKLRGYLEGLSSLPSDVGSSSHRNNSKWLQQLEENIMFLEGMGIDASKVIARYPLFGHCSMQNVQTVLEYLSEHCGLHHRKQLVRAVTNEPQLLAQCVKKTLEPAVVFLLDEVRLQKKDLGKVINRCPRLLMSSVDGQLRPTMLYLQSLGFTNMPAVVSNNPTLLTFGIRTKLMPKIEFLQSIGLSADESIQVLIRFPAIFNYSIDSNLQVKYRYLLDTMGRGLDDVKAFPQYFGYSLEYRIRPRHQFLEKCGMCLSVPNMLKPTDEAFYKRFQDGRCVPNQAAVMKEEVVPSCT